MLGLLECTCDAKYASLHGRGKIFEIQAARWHCVWVHEISLSEELLPVLEQRSQVQRILRLCQVPESS